MMEMMILCFGALLATLAAWVYLNVQKPKVYEPETKDEEAAAAAVEVAEKAACSPFARPSIGRRVFLILMMLSLCGMSVALGRIYPNNTLVENGKLIFLLACLFVAANIDARFRIIPNKLVLAAMVARVVFWMIELFANPNSFWRIMKNDLAGCLLIIGFFVVGVLLVKGGIGMGDVKLMLVMALFQGFYGVVSSLFCSLFVAFIYAIVVLLLRKKTKKDSVAFAPAILLGTMLSVFLTGM